MSIPSPVTGQKRPSTTLLPAFEPLSSSPGFPRPSKRQARTETSKYENNYNKYPTPIPSSTTGVFSSPLSFHTQPSESYTCPSLPERTPLSSLPTVTLPDDGKILRMGRSSKSSDFRLPSSKLISRVHVEARYIAATAPLEPNSIEIKCTGWNGLKLHSSSQTYELAKGDTFTSESEFAEIILDIQDARVLVSWPGRDSSNITGFQNDFWDEGNVLSRRQPEFSSTANDIQSSPLRCPKTITSPISPSPFRSRSSNQLLIKLHMDESKTDQMYEDTSSASLNSEINKTFSSIRPTNSFATLIQAEPSELKFENHFKEDDSAVHSFDSSSAENSSQMASISLEESINPASLTSSPVPLSRALSPSEFDPSEILDHLANQLAFSPKSSIPLSDLFLQLSETIKESYDIHYNKCLTKNDLQKILTSSQCIGVICREGKDAAGKLLESEYYYIPEEDQNEARRNAVHGIRKPSLRNCRKKHKQYFWRKPRTP